MTIKELTDYLEKIAPLNYQEDYDNCGLIVGDANAEITNVLVSLDVTLEVIEEAIAKKCNMIIAHHPLIFRGLKKLNGKNYIEKSVIKAIKNDIAIYAIHTNLDNITNGVNFKIAEKLNLQDVSILKPKSDTLMKLTVFCPLENTPKLQNALYAAGAGEIGNYSNCSFKSAGIGSFKPNSAAVPVIGQNNKYEEVEENRLEVVFPSFLKGKILEAMRKNHMYEEVAYYLHKIENHNQDVGSGAVGTLPEAMNPNDFLAYLKEAMNLKVIRFTETKAEKIKKVAVCGGVGSFLLLDAKYAGADAFVTADYKYHEFFDAENQIMIADIGHFESEVYTKDLIVEIISKKFTNFASYLSEIDTNPIKYYH
ncbi:MAG TPA: Nif3-like dinuclear metal center hexameric protein [Leadbetterella sp.]|nr:Nif3-like dinuclear metal center hexameric protein [Leadbetterella sp.]